MLNYIWAGLIIFSLVFALVSDGRDLARDTYRNGRPLSVSVRFPEGYQAGARRQPVGVVLDSATLENHYGVAVPQAEAYTGTLIQTADGRELRFAEGASLPEPLASIRSSIAPRDNDLRGPVELAVQPGDTITAAAVRFAPVRFLKLNAITRAALDFAETAVTIVLGLIGALALWLGLLRIAERSGLIGTFVRIVQPVLRPLFPEIPAGHPALGFIALNLTANMLGLGNAATPLGLKAMEELQTLNRVPDTATNSMVMLLAMNTASVQIVPPVLLVAIMGLQVNQLFFSIIIVTALSLIVAIAATKGLGRLKRYRATDPALAPSE